MFAPPTEQEIRDLTKIKDKDPFAHLSVDPPLKMAEVIQKKNAEEKILDITSHLIVNRSTFKTRSEKIRHIISLLEEVLND